MSKLFWIVEYITVSLLSQEFRKATCACTGSGFPVEWTTDTAGVTYWFVTEAIKRKFTSNYAFTDYYTATDTVYGPAPECVSEYFDASSGYYYYLMYYTDENIYSLDTNRQICHGFKQYDNVIREYFEDLQGPGVLQNAVDCVALLASKTSSFALTRYNPVYINCPFSNEEYFFTFSKDGNPDYCSSSTSSLAYITDHAIALKSCYDPLAVNKSNPFYGEFFCLSTWSPADSRDTKDGGDFIVVEMVDSIQWPYCGRYKVNPDGTIVMSLYLAMGAGVWYPVYCVGSLNNEFYTTNNVPEFSRFVFTPERTTTTTTTTTELTTTAASPTTSETSTTTPPTTTVTTTTLPPTTEPTTTPPTTTEFTTTPPSTTTPTTTEYTTTPPTTTQSTTTLPTTTESTTTASTTTEPPTTPPTTTQSTTTPPSTTESTTTPPTTTEPTTTPPTTTQSTTKPPTTTASTTTPSSTAEASTTAIPTSTTSALPTTSESIAPLLVAETSTSPTTTTVAISESSSSIWDSLTDLYWPWWILIAVATVLLTTLACCCLYALLRRKKQKFKIDDSNETGANNTNTKSMTNMRQVQSPRASNGPNPVLQKGKPKVINVQPKWRF